MTLEVETMEKEADTCSHSLQHGHTLQWRFCHVTMAHFNHIKGGGDSKQDSSADSPVQNAPSHGQQSVIHSQSVVHTPAGLDEERADGQADQRARDRGELYMAVHTTP